MTEIERLLPPEKMKYIKFLKRQNGKALLDIIPSGESFSGGITANEYWEVRNLAYIFTIRGEVVKIGETERSMPERLYDYNYGNLSGGMYKTLKRLYGFSDRVKLYILPVEESGETDSLWEDELPFTSEDYERKLLKKYYKLFGRLPVGNPNKKGFV